LASEVKGSDALAVAALLRPTSIVIVGASEKSRWSRSVYDNLTRGGFGGEVHLVNRRGGVIHGQRAAESCVAVGASIDLGIVLVPAHAIVDAIDDLACAGARSAIVLTSGFAETGEAGALCKTICGSVHASATCVSSVPTASGS